MKRLAENPLIRPADVTASCSDFEVIGTFNPAVARYRDEVILLVRVAERPTDQDPHWAAAPIWNAQDRRIETLRVRRDDPDFVEQDKRAFQYRGRFYLTSISHLRLARSPDGIHFTVEPKPALAPQTPTETFGLEDPRTTRIGSKYWITYKAVSEHGITTGVAATSDFRSFTRHGLIFCPENLDVVLFPQQFNDQYVAWTRPVGGHPSPPTIWLARSPDLLHWGAHQPVLAPRPGMWDSARVGASCVPFKTPQGWIEIYHGADATHRYSAGAALIDPDDPARVLARSRHPLMQPEAPYETDGFFGNVIFPGGADARPDGTVFIYYGAADETTCAAATSTDELLNHLAS
ncbi:MAG: glycoside hydrolase family 130 protein [Phycisphaeraceae bacterium]